MDEYSDWLSKTLSAMDLYEKNCKPVLIKHGLSQTEVDILSFLHYNPHLDNAKDIVELRGLPKANVSQGVESLVQKELLTRTQDKRDRLRIHLLLTAKVALVMNDIDEVRKGFIEKLLKDFSPEERDIYAKMNRRVSKNVLDALGGN